MSQASGANARVTYVEESTWGTTPGSPTMRLLKAATPGVGLKAQVQPLISTALDGSRSVQAARGGDFSVQGAIPFEMPYDGIGTLLKHALGSVSTTGAGPYTHVIKRAALPAGLSFEIGYADITQYQIVRGCRINAMNLTVPDTGFVTGSLDVLGKSAPAMTGTSLGTPADFTHDPFVKSDAAFEEGGSANGSVVNFTMALANNLQPQPVVGSREINSLSEGRGRCSGALTVLLENATLINKGINETQSTIKCTFTIGANSLEFFYPKVKYFGDLGAGIETDQGLLVPMTYEAIYDETEQTDLRITLINDEATI